MEKRKASSRYIDKVVEVPFDVRVIYDLETVEIPRNHLYLMWYLRKVYDIVTDILARIESTKKHKDALEQQEAILPASKLSLLRHLNRKYSNYTILHYDLIRDVESTGAGEGWSIASYFFLVRCSILVLEHSIARRAQDAPPDDMQKSLQEIGDANTCAALERYELALYRKGKKIGEYTQMELYDQLVLLAKEWTHVTEFPYMEAIVEALLYRCAHLVAIIHTDKVLDGGREWICVCKPGKEVLYAAHPRYIAEMAAFFLWFERSFFILYRIFRNESFLPFGLYDTHDIMRDDEEGGGGSGAAEEDVWTDRKRLVDEAEQAVGRWMDRERSTIVSTGFPTMVHRTCTMLCLRPGEEERYVRVNSGAMPTQPVSVWELCRTDLQQQYWMYVLKQKRNTAFYMKPERPGLMCMITKLRVIDMFIEREFGATWFEYVFLPECSFSKKVRPPPRAAPPPPPLAPHPRDAQHKLLQESIEPHIVQCMGECNVVYRTGGDMVLYRTRTPERSFLVWCAIYLQNHDVLSKGPINIDKDRFLRWLSSEIGFVPMGLEAPVSDAEEECREEDRFVVEVPMGNT